MGNTTEAKKKKCLIIRPNSEKLVELRGHATNVQEIIERALKDCRYELNDEHALPAPGSILETLFEHLLTDDLVIADLTGADANVYYQVAIRHVIGKPIICLCDKGVSERELPIALRSVGIIFLDKTQFQIADSIRAAVEVVEAPGYKSEFPAAKAFEGFMGKRAMLERKKSPEKLIAEFVEFSREKLATQFSALENLTRQLEDTTRKPLYGIDQVFVKIYYMLQEAKVGGRIWFVGMTFGLGPPHRHRRKLPAYVLAMDQSRGSSAEVIEPAGITMDSLIQATCKELPSFDAMIPKLHSMLGSIMEKANDPVVVCLTHSRKALTKNFLAKLAKLDSYRTLESDLNGVIKEIVSLHKAVADKVTGPRPIRYVDSIPLQILIVEKNETSPLAFGKKACVVFHVGTGNIGTRVLEDGEIGFYTEVDSLVEIFETMAESLWEAADQPTVANVASPVASS